MDKTLKLGTKKVLASSLLLLTIFLARGVVAAPVPWSKKLRARLEDIDKQNAERFGIYVKDLETGEEFSYRGDETWYVASGVKVPIALEVLHQIDEGKFTLQTQVELGANDYIDGAGSTNSHVPGSMLSIRYLLEQMLIHSDNTASDLLIKKVGLAQINENLKEWGATGFQEITTLSDVRRLAYSGIHPNAVHLLNRDIRALKNVKNQEARVTKLASILNLRMQDLRTKNLDAAYSAYYGKQLNSATLRAYGDLLEKMSEGGRLSPSSDKFLIETMERAETGKQRVIAGFPAGYVFAHKTGTQHARVCDFGIMRKVEGDKRVVIAACTRNIASLTKAEHVLKSVGEAVYKSGLFKAGL